jgi:hypothetical protein
MKNIKTELLIILGISLLITNSTLAQTECRVLDPGIDGTYIGKCRNGLAHGYGVAEAKNRYEGRFRNGLPHGKGTYTWANGDVYTGSWQKGMQHGQGVYTYKENGELKVKNGIWRKGKYIRAIPVKPYSIGQITNLERYSIKRLGDGNKVMVRFLYMGRNGRVPPDFDFKILSGVSLTEGLNTGYEEVSFPTKISIRYTVPDKLGQGLRIPVRFEVEIVEQGNWEISLYN